MTDNTELGTFDPAAWHEGGIVVLVRAKKKKPLARAVGAVAAATTALLVGLTGANAETLFVSASSAGASECSAISGPGHTVLAGESKPDPDSIDPAKWPRLVEAVARAHRNLNVDEDLPEYAF